MKRLAALVQSGRPLESLLMIGFPMLAALLAGMRRPQDFLIHSFWVWLGCMSVFAFNAWGGFSTDGTNPRLRRTALVAGRLKPVPVLFYSIALFLASAAGLSARGTHLVLIAIAVYCVWAVYSHPRILWKGVPILSSVLHFVGGVLMFFLGYSWNGRWDGMGLAACLFLTLSFVAGHLNHQVMDYEADAEAGVETTAVFLGPLRTYDLSFAVFTGAYGILALFAAWGEIAWTLVLPFLCAGLVHAVFYLRWRGPGIEKRAAGYQSTYRFLFLVAGIVSGIMHFSIVI